MRKQKFKPYTLQTIEIASAGSEGKAIARHEGQVIFVDFAVPGDIVDLLVYAKKRKHCFARVDKIITASSERVESFCKHFGTCGGCKWQHMSYAAQLKYKQQQVQDNFERIGRFPFPDLMPIIGSDQIREYRNKLEFTFTDKKWLADLSLKDDLTESEHLGLGFHIPGRFDKVLDIDECHLMDNLQNKIRLVIKKFAIENNFSFYNVYSQQGLLRNIIIRNTSLGEWMLIVVFKEDDTEKINLMMHFLKSEFSEISSLLYIVNPKQNDTIYDLDVQVFSGNNFIHEKLENLTIKIQPKSFFQTNTTQTLKLYSIAREFANLSGDEVVYDLYTGVGSIANFVARNAKTVVGIESIEQAVADAKVNSSINKIKNTHFYLGDLKDALTDDLIAKHGKPDVIITDPPRAGMHENTIRKILELEAKKIVYVSCNPATQARDIALLIEKYVVLKVQAVDMFPHTHHVENVVLLSLRN